MQRSCIDYAMSVIVGRALPDVRDGLKPVHRKILYGMYDSGFRPDRSFVKCAPRGRRRDGQLPPARRHGDLRHALVPDGPAVVAALPADRSAGQLRLARQRPGGGACRYTECRLTPLAMEMLRDIDKETVDFVPNYAGNTVEPDHPARPDPEPARQRL